MPLSELRPPSHMMKAGASGQGDHDDEHSTRGVAGDKVDAARQRAAWNWNGRPVDCRARTTVTYRVHCGTTLRWSRLALLLEFLQTRDDYREQP